MNKLKSTEPYTLWNVSYTSKTNRQISEYFSIITQLCYMGRLLPSCIGHLLSHHYIVAKISQDLVQSLAENWKHTSSTEHIYTLSVSGGVFCRLSQSLCISFAVFSFRGWPLPNTVLPPNSQLPYSSPLCIHLSNANVLEKVKDFMHVKT